MPTLRTLAIAGTLGFMPFTGALAQDAAEASVQRRAPAGGDRPLVAAISRPPLSVLGEAAPVLPPLPEGVAELKFQDFYQMPVGPRGIEVTEQLKQLAGKKVRLAGYFVFEDWSTCSCPVEPADASSKRRPAMPAWMKHVVPGRAMLAPVPSAVSLDHYGLSDDLPPQVAFLHIESRFGEPVFFRPGLFTATGILELGNKSEGDGRVSHVRLKIESDTDLVPVRRAATAHSPTTTQPNIQATNP